MATTPAKKLPVKKPTAKQLATRIQKDGAALSKLLTTAKPKKAAVKSTKPTTTKPKK